MLEEHAGGACPGMQVESMLILIKVKAMMTLVFSRAPSFLVGLQQTGVPFA